MKSEARVAGSSQVIGVVVEDSDMAGIAGWEDLSLTDRWRAMTKRADMMIVEYMLRNGHISDEYARQRMEEISR